MSEPGANEIFQSAVNNAVLFKSVVCIGGFACIFMAYRLLMRRAGPSASADPGDEQSVRLASNERSISGLLLGLFGMAVIAFALFRNAPLTPQDESAVHGKGSAGSSIDLSPGTRNSPAESEFSTKVRDGAVAAPAMELPSGEKAAKEKPTEGPPAIRGATGVQTKGAFAPFPKPGVETNRLRAPFKLRISNP